MAKNKQIMRNAASDSQKVPIEDVGVLFVAALRDLNEMSSKGSTLREIKRYLANVDLLNIASKTGEIFRFVSDSLKEGNLEYANGKFKLSEKLYPNEGTKNTANITITDKSPVKNTEKSSDKNTAKSSIKNATKNSIKNPGKSSIKNTTKGLIKKATKGSIKKATKGSIKKATKGSIKRATKGSIKNTAKSAAKKTTRKKVSSGKGKASSRKKSAKKGNRK